MSDGPVSEPILSEFSDDPEMMELVELFVSEMPGRIQELERCFEQGIADQLAGVAHQIKGAGAGYGFSQMTDAAATLENAIRGGETDLPSLRNEFDRLIDICNRASAG
ncbi:MAG: Hpt domain-containing protein [Planctomycetota bacterium]